MICLYWIIKLKTRFLSADYAEALAAAEKAKALLWASAVWIQLLDYFYYTALTVAACYENASADEQREWRALLTAHQEQLREWAENYPPTFADKHALVAAEIARLEGRDADAMRLYEQAIRSASENGFVQNEGLAYEVAARFYAARGFATIGNAYLRNARYCYLRWGADGKVRQLDRLHPHLAAAEGNRPTATNGTPVQHLDVASVVKASQALSSEIELPKLIEQLMTIALENAGADHGLLILPAKDDHLIQAEARATGDQVGVVLCQKPITGISCPESLVRYVIRTHESVILDDASRPNLFSEDDYLRGRQAKSILCLPLLKQGRLTGLLYIENTLTSHAFTSDRTAILELLAAQAAISLENTRLYSDLQEREAKVRRLVDSNIIGIFIWDFEGRIIEANEAFLHMVGHSSDDLVSGRVRWTALTPSEWSGADERAVAELRARGSCKPREKEYFRKDGTRVPVLVGGATFGERRDQGVAFVLDLTERKQAEESLRESERRYREAQMELAHVNRVTTMGQLTASIAHEVNQPIAAAVTSADAGLRWLGAQPPDLEEVRDSFDRIIKAGNRAGEVIGRIRALIKKVPERKSPLDINETILETIALTRSEMRRHHILLQTELGNGLPRVWGDRVQLQQVILNLIMNAIEAMSEVSDGSRQLLIGTRVDQPDGVIVAVRDSGPGLKPESLDHLFDPFYTTKPAGMGMGLSICRSIIEAHGGRTWAAANVPQGASFHFRLPAHGVTAS
jgi:PAS domain S-box-containing protein